MSAFRLTLALVAGGFTIAPAGHAQEVRPDEVIAVERAALDRWGRGDPQGFLDTYASEVTYFDPGQDRRVDSLDRSEERRVGKECRPWRAQYHGIQEMNETY